MPIGRIDDAAGATTGFLYDTDVPDLISESPGKLTFSAPILSGPRAGKNAIIEWLGAFDLSAGLGSVTGWRESVGSALHLSLKLDAPVALDDIFDAGPGDPLVL